VSSASSDTGEEKFGTVTEPVEVTFIEKFGSVIEPFEAIEVTRDTPPILQ
jgi:hypothetical protein